MKCNPPQTQSFFFSYSHLFPKHLKRNETLCVLSLTYQRIEHNKVRKIKIITADRKIDQMTCFLLNPVRRNIA